MSRIVIKLLLSGLLLNVGSIATAALITFDDRATFTEALGDSLQVQDWSDFPAGTVLEGAPVDGITYSSTSSEALVVGSLRGANWRIGYDRGNGRYSSFSNQILTFAFDEPLDYFAVALSQGNQNQGVRGEGSSTWRITTGDESFESTAIYTLDDFSGESFFGVSGLSGASFVDVQRVSSDSNIVWNVREMLYGVGSNYAVPEPPPWALLGLPLFGLFARKFFG
ncbi:MAG: hypothetical protein NXH85_13545 [Pseudomonadaceae bacterium]|nr:hypothetical protein [Pseudomonadaceae bacterium]